MPAVDAMFTISSNVLPLCSSDWTIVNGAYRLTADRPLEVGEVDLLDAHRRGVAGVVDQDVDLAVHLA